MARFPKVKLRGPVAFPSNVANGTGIGVTKANGIWTITLDVADFHISNVPSDETSTTYAISFGGVTTDNPDGVYSLTPFSGFQGVSADLTSLAELNTDGIVARIGDADYVTRTLTGTANRITVTNGGGIAGNPTFDISSAYVGQATITTLGTITTGVWHGTVIGATYGGFGADVSASSGVPLFAAGVPTFTSTSGAGNFVRVSNAALVTPDLGTPSAAVLTNATGTASGLTAGHVTTNANLTGDVTSVGNATMIGATKVTSAMLNADVFSTAHSWSGGQSFTAPLLGTPASGVATNLTGTAAGLTAGNVTTNANLTGAITSVGNAASLGSFTTAQLNTALSDGDVATLAGSEELTNKTLNASVGKGTWTASGTWTLPAFTLGGTISGGGNNVNNVIIGAVTPLAGSFTTLASGVHTVTSSSASALTVGPNGATNPTLKVDGSIASTVTGIAITGAGVGSRAFISAISSGSNEGLSINAKASGTIILADTSTGNVQVGGSVTFNPNSGNIAALSLQITNAATVGSLNGNTFTTGTYTLTGAAAKTLTFNNSITLAGTDATTMTFPATSATLARTDAANTFTGTQTIGALVATTVNGNTITTGTGVLTLGAGKTATISNTLTFTGTDSSSVAFGAGGTVAYAANKLSIFAATTSAELAGVISDETGSGSLVFGTSPVLSTVDARGTWTVGSGTWTLPAHTLGGTISGGGNQINNVIIGNSTPLAGSFTTLTTTSTINGVTLDNTAWSTYTSTFSATTGTATVVAKSKTIGKSTLVNIDVTFTSAVTGTFSVTLPTNSVNYTAFPVVIASAGFLAITNANAGSNILSVLKYDGTQITANGSHIVITGVYESP